MTIGAAFCLFFKDAISIPWSSSLRLYFKKCPNQVLYWEAIRHGIANGYRFLDFGRSVRGDGTFEFKRHWGAEPVQLHWVYEPEIDAPSRHTASGQYGKAARLWQYLPVSLAKIIGPWIRKGIPG